MRTVIARRLKADAAIQSLDCFAVLAMTTIIIFLLPSTTQASEIYQEKCARCHGEKRLGGEGPALLPENLGRLKKDRAIDIIANGAPATQMPTYGKELSPQQIEELVDFIYSAPDVKPSWGEKEINATHVIHNDLGSLPETPVHDADPQNLFTVVETGDHHVSILDGDKLEPIWRFASRFALHGGAKYSPDGRFVYLASRDGWVSKYDLYNLKIVAEIRAGINTRNIAVDPLHN